MIVSYPRSGNTWTRFLLANLLGSSEPVTFATLDTKVPDIYKTRRSQLVRFPRPRFLKSHEYFDPRYPKVIYIVRDPRDVALSYYYFQVKKGRIEDGYSMDHYVSRFVAGEVDEYGSWAEHVASWLATRQGTPSFLLLRYEDIKTDPRQELARIAGFLQVSRSSEHIARAVELSSAQRTQELEKREQGVWAETRRSRKDIPFVRNASSGEWKSAFSPGAAAKIETAWGFLMSLLGYPLFFAAAPSDGQQSRLAGNSLLIHGRVSL
jgi:hypothetical protein